MHHLCIITSSVVHFVTSTNLEAPKLPKLQKDYAKIKSDTKVFHFNLNLSIIALMQSTGIQAVDGGECTDYCMLMDMIIVCSQTI